MLKSAIGKLDNLLGTVTHVLHEQKCLKIHAAMKALVYVAEMGWTSKCSPL
jgi:hypothetical protein